MAIIRSYTDIEQSRKLAEILPLESADYFHSLAVNIVVTEPYIIDCCGEKCVPACLDTVPCWSLASLLEQLPYEVCDDDGNSVYLQINKEEDVYQLEYTDPNGDFESIETDRYEHFVDACVTMIEKLNELNLL